MMKAQQVMTSLENISPLLINLLNENIDVTLKVTGNSMRPLFAHNKDSVVLMKCDVFQLKRGDMPLYKRDNGQYVLHRIIKVNKDSYNLCGDGQYTIEKNLPKKNVIAVVKSFEQNGKMYSSNCLGYQIYWRFRVLTIPFRRIFHRIISKIRSA